VRSVNSMVIALASTGSGSSSGDGGSSSRAFMVINHTNSGIRSGFFLWLFVDCC